MKALRTPESIIYDFSFPCEIIETRDIVRMILTAQRDALEVAAEVATVCGVCETCNKQGLRNCGYFNECTGAKIIVDKDSILNLMPKP